MHAVDSSDHITDFESASDHVITLRKIQQLNTPLGVVDGRSVNPWLRNRPSRTNATGTWRSVFESDVDATYEDGDGTTSSRSGRRWKYRGPWLSGMTEGEFQNFIQREVRRRKGEFREYLRRHLGRARAAERRHAERQMLESVTEGEGEGDEASEASIANEDLSDSELDHAIRRLRQDPASITPLIHDFLDLPANPVGGLLSYTDGGDGFYAETGPPKTHPSAGLTYLRTAAVLDNHPVLGPQAQPTPVQARVLSARGGGGTSILGVAGVAAEDRVHSSFANREGNSMSAPVTGDPTTPRGTKVWVRVVKASVDAGGRIDLNVASATRNSVMIHQGKPEEIRDIARDAAYQGATSRSSTRLAESLPSGLASAQRSRTPTTRSDLGWRGKVAGGSHSYEKLSSLLNADSSALG